MSTPDLLRKLIAACVDDARTLLHESKFVDASRAEILTRLAKEREGFVTELERLGVPGQRHDGSWSELLREAGRTTEVAAAGRNSGDAVATCRHSRTRTESHYDEAVEAVCPDEVRCVIEAQRRRLHDEAEELDRLQF